MDNKTNLKIKKYNMIMWSFLGAVSLIILVLTVLSLAGVMKVHYSPVLGILIPLIMVLSACSQIRAYFMETMFFYEKAQESDKDAVMELLDAVKEDMAQNGIDQWDEVYPSIADVGEDIREGTLTLVKQGRDLTAVYTINRRAHISSAISRMIPMAMWFFTDCVSIQNIREWELQRECLSILMSRQ